MSTGFLAILDDIAALSKVVAASLDDAAAQATKAGAKAAGIVIDDAAVTPRYVTNLASERELPIIGKIAAGSLRNKLLFLLPGALVLSLIAPWAITPILMLGGAYLCLEGFHKVMDLVQPHGSGEESVAAIPLDQLKAVEDERVAGAIRTDFILSAEIMAISLAAVANAPFFLRAGVLAAVGVAMTALVYGAVALIVKADDVGAHLALSKNAAARAIGSGLVHGMPGFLKALTLVGMLAMLWVGGGIIVHGLHELGWPQLEEAIHHAAESLTHAAGPLEPALGWLTTAAFSGVIGLVIGAACAPLEHHVIAPAMKRFAPAKA